MKKGLKRFLIIIGVILGILFLVSVGAKYKNELKYFGQEQVQIIDNIDESFSEAVMVEAGTLTTHSVKMNNLQCENYEIVKIGLPVKSVKDFRKDSKYTVYLVDVLFDDNGNVTEYKKVDEFEFTIEKGTYNKNLVCEWVYFDCNIVVEYGQTLVLGAATDTISLAYEYSDSIETFYDDVFNAETFELNKGLVYIDIYGYELK